jgi:hypothetical protein
MQAVNLLDLGLGVRFKFKKTPDCDNNEIGN